MITKDDIIEVGYVSKTHGLSGNLEVVITVDWLDELGVDFIFIDIDGCYIPFRIAEERTKNSGRLLKLDNIDTKEEAERLGELAVRIPRTDKKVTQWLQEIWNEGETAEADPT